jgi:hypothetical protein
MRKKQNQIQVTGSVECGQALPLSAVILLPVMIIVMEKLKLL